MGLVLIDPGVSLGCTQPTLSIPLTNPGVLALSQVQGSSTNLSWALVVCQMPWQWLKRQRRAKKVPCPLQAPAQRGRDTRMHPEEGREDKGGGTETPDHRVALETGLASDIDLTTNSQGNLVQIT